MLVRDWEAEKKDLQEAFDIISDKLVKADQEIERLKTKMKSEYRRGYRNGHRKRIKVKKPYEQT